MVQAMAVEASSPQLGTFQGTLCVAPLITTAKLDSKLRLDVAVDFSDRCTGQRRENHSFESTQGARMRSSSSEIMGGVMAGG